MDEVQIENWVYKQALNKIMNIERVKNLIAAEKASSYDIENIVSDAVARARTGIIGLEYRGYLWRRVVQGKR